MITTKHHRSLIGAALLGAGLCMPGNGASAEHLLLVNGNSSVPDPNCRLAGTGTQYYVEGWGFDAIGGKVCEISVAAGGTNGLGLCLPGLGWSLFPAVSHAPRITIRGGPSGNWASVQVMPTTPATIAPQTTWTNPNGLLTYNLPAQGSCAGGTITALTKGFE